MAYSQNKKEYNAQYIRENIKRIPLDMQRDQYDQIKAAAEAAGESVNGYVKKAIAQRMARENPQADSPANYDRWETPPGAIKVTSKPTPEQQKLVAELNAQAAERERSGCQ